MSKITEASTTKESGVDVRFPIGVYLIIVQSNKTILIYELLKVRR
ncbi:hypothetical protein [Haladaptatus halobius]|nr:hypothetical protein [Haladaptatus halobius]